MILVKWIKEYIFKVFRSDIRLTSEDRCVCCDCEIPEGRLVCYKCENK